VTSSDVVGIDLTAVGDWMRELCIAFEGPLRAERIGLGQSNLTFRLSDSRGRSWILRRPPLGRLLHSAHDVAREFRVLAALAATDVPVPRVFGLTEGAGFSAPTMLMEHVGGLVVDDIAIAEGLLPAVRRAAGLSMVETLAKIHAVDPERIGLADLASHSPYAQRQLKRWSQQWVESKRAELPDLDRLTELLRANLPTAQSTALVHGDFHIRNVILSAASGSVLAALDWELCTLGEPLADLGSLLAYWPESGDRPTGLFTASLLEGFPSRADLIERYATTSGRDVDELPFWHVLGLWKVAVIVDGVQRRANDEPLNAAKVGLPEPEFVERMVARAWDVARETGLRKGPPKC
jgi:aminoglycoside phosphotransferase (APT) family kinase protein